MNEEIISTNQAEVSDKFKLGKKWFWIGVVIAILHGLSGLIFGIALITEKKYRREGLVIIFIAVAVIVASVIWRLIQVGIIK